MTKTEASELGRSAYHAGSPISPALNSEIQAAVADLPVGGGAAEIMRAFVDGWTTANLAAEWE
jgi:hypothetical protein